MACEYVMPVLHRLQPEPGVTEPTYLGEKLAFWGPDKERKQQIRRYKRDAAKRFAREGAEVLEWLQFLIHIPDNTRGGPMKR